MSAIVNPYIAGAPVTEQRMFFGREDIFQWIENSIAGQYADHILVVHGQRRVGKTSVLKQLGNRLPNRFIPVFFDLQGRTHTTLDHFLWWLAREIVRVLKQDRGLDVSPPDKNAFSADPETFENQFLSGLQSMLGQDTLLLTFDEFDNLEESEVKEDLARPLIDYLRRLMGESNLNFIFSIGSSGRKLENMQAAYTDFFKTALYKKISFLSEEQTHHLVTKPVEGVIEYERGAVDRIFAVTSGHPYFTQLTCHELFARCQRTEQRKITKTDVEAILDDVVERGTVNLKFVWDEASDIEKWSLAALAQMETKTENRAVADYLRKNRVRFSESDLTSGLLHLREKDVLTPNNRFVIHLMQLWLQKNRPIEQAREELTEANPIANRFIEIGLEFRDSGQYEKAIEFFRQALSVSSDNLQAQVNIALTYATQGQLEQAIAEFEKALTIDDEDVASRSGLCDAHLALGDAAMKRGRTKDAVLSYQRVMAINAEHLEARQRMSEISRRRAEKALADGKDEESLSAFAEALKFTPEDQALIARSEKVRAEKNVKVLAEQLARSEKEVSTRNWDKALAALNDALAIAPDDESILKKIEAIKEKQLQERLDAIVSKVDTAEKAGRWDTAIAGLNEYLQLKPDDAAIQKRIADMVEAKHAAWLIAINERVDRAVTAQNWDEALSALNEALRIEPDNAEMKTRVAQVYETRRIAELNAMLKRADEALGASRWDEAINILNDGLASEPENETLKTKLAEARKAKREARLQAALSFADSAAQVGKWEAAVASLNEVLANEPDNAEFQQKLDEVHAREHQSRWEAAQTQAESLQEAEQFEKALQAWQSYLSLYPVDHERVEEETRPITQERDLFDLYSKAEGAIAARDFDGAIPLLKEIIIRDENYKDASRLLTNAIESRRTGTTQRRSKSRKKPAKSRQAHTQDRPKAGGRRIWIIGGVLVILVLAIGGGLFWLEKNGLLAIPSVFSNKIITPTPQGGTIAVTSAQDSGAGTLRQALADAQAGDTITFDPVAFPPTNPVTITVKSGLPAITKGHLTLDASNAGVILDGSQAGGVWTVGIEVNSEYNVIKGLQVVHFTGAGIVLHENAHFNIIGGDRSIGIGPLGEGNLLSDNSDGIGIQGSDNIIAGNLIGTDIAGEEMGNRYPGIFLEENASRNTIGPDNTIAYNGVGGGGGGVEIRNLQAQANIITANSIYDNLNQGIFYTIGDPAQYTYQSPPVIIFFDISSGVVSGHTCENCVVEIFSTETQDGRNFEGTVTADEYGTFSLSKGEALSGPFLTATTRSLGDNTSEFSQPTSTASVIQIALDTIQYEAPTYNTSFDSLDVFGGAPEGNVKAENGKLIVTSENQQYAGTTLQEIRSDQFAVEFDLLILDSSTGGHCIFETSNEYSFGDSSWRAMSAIFFLDGQTGLAHYVYPDQFSDLVTGKNNFDFSKSSTVTLIFLGDQIAAFIDGQLAYTALNPAGNVVYTRQALSANQTAQCEYDNFKIWDLSDVDFSASTGNTPTPTPATTPTPSWVADFSEPILQAIANRQPDFQDDFSQASADWALIGFMVTDRWISTRIQDGVLQMDIGNGDENDYEDWATHPMMRFRNFALQVDVNFSKGFPIVEFGSNNATNEGWEFQLSSNGFWELSFIDSLGNPSKVSYGSAGSYPGDSVNITIISSDADCAIYLNSTPITYVNDSKLGNGTEIRLGLVGELDIDSYKYSTVKYDNLKIWNLDYIQNLP